MTPTAYRLPWSDEPTSLTGRLDRLESRVNDYGSITTLGHFTVEATENVPLDPGASVVLWCSGCQPAIPERVVGDRLRVSVGDWRRSKSQGRSFRRLDWRKL